MSVLADVLPAALAIAASPFPVIPAILLLLGDRPRATAGSFLAGWVAGVGVVTAVFVLLTEVVEERASTPTWASWVRIALGVVLVAYGVRLWLTRGSADAEPGWMQGLARATPASAARLAVLLSVANPKVLLLAAVGGLAIGADDLSAAGDVAAVVAFTVVASVSVAVPVLLFLVLGDRMLGPLRKARDWLQRNNAAVMAVVITVIGVVVGLEGLRGL